MANGTQTVHVDDPIAAPDGAAEVVAGKMLQDDWQVGATGARNVTIETPSTFVNR
ncbi:MAG: hypothetical protein ACRDJW_02080 [Thermomicrobiales bacterium]